MRMALLAARAPARLLLTICVTFPTYGVAAPADWKAYLCRYGPADAEKVQLLRINEKDRRVVVRERGGDRDVAAKFDDRGVSFDGPPELFWDVSTKDGKVTVIGRFGPMPGTCRQVDD